MYRWIFEEIAALSSLALFIAMLLTWGEIFQHCGLLLQCLR